MSHLRQLMFLAAGIAGCLPLAAHHSTRGYDKTRVVPVKGVVAGITWMNPHVEMLLDVRDSSGKTTRLTVELAAVVSLVSRGWRKSDVKQGDEITIDAWLPKDGSARALARFVHLPDGRVVSGMSAWDCESAAQEGCSGPFKLAPSPQK